SRTSSVRCRGPGLRGLPTRLTCDILGTANGPCDVQDISDGVSARARGRCPCASTVMPSIKPTAADTDPGTQLSRFIATCLLFWSFGQIDKLAPAGTHTAHLQDSVFLDLDIVRNIGRLGVEATGRQCLQPCVVKGFSVAGCEHAGQDGDLAGIWMSMRRDLETLREFETQRV